jgi:SAM-dependent methyltransferase
MGDDAEWFAANRELLERAYLAAGDPRGQSGFHGDAARWERGRRVIAEAIDRDGAFLDVGCANGLLLETLVGWTRARGCRIEPYGLDISAALAALARSRLPAWADRIEVGNALTWAPPRCFDLVRTELEYVPDARGREYVARLLRDVVAPGGRLIVCAYGSATRPERRVAPVGDLLRGWDFPVAGEAEAADLNGVVFTRVAWIDGEARRPTVAGRHVADGG